PTGAQIYIPPHKAMSPEMFRLVFDWMTKDSIKCPRESILDLMSAAFYMYMPHLVRELLNCFDDKNIFNTGDAVQLYFKSQNTPLAGVGNLMLNAVGKHFLLIVHSDEFRELTARCLCRMIEPNLLYVQTEIEVLYAVFLWLYTEYNKRIDVMPVILSHVRFQLMPPAFLYYFATLLSELDRDVARILFPILQKTMWDQQEIYLCNIDSDDDYEIEVETERSWIVDPECPYREDIELGRYIDHSSFIKYVASLNNAESFTERIYEK
ncbi:hypothetical protein KR093_011011, partial [Drosophila rubida]